MALKKKHFWTIINDFRVWRQKSDSVEIVIVTITGKIGFVFFFFVICVLI